MNNYDMEDEIEVPSHLLALYVVTSGLQGDSLGTDQKEITWLSYTIIDARENKEIARRQYVVKPSYMEEDYFFVNYDERPDAAESHISNAALAHAPALTDKVIREKGISLLDAMKDFETWILSRFPLLHSKIQLIVDGQAPIRQCLYPEATRKFGGPLWRYRDFFDLRKEFSACYFEQQELKGIKQMMQRVNLSSNARLPSDYYAREAADMVSLVRRMLTDGHVFRSPETVYRNSKPDLQLDDDCVVRIRGLGWPLIFREVREFFAGLNIVSNEISVRMSGQDKRVGEAIVCFESKEHGDLALKRHNQFVGQLLVEVHKASIHEYETLERCQFLVLIRGLSWTDSAEKIVNFFASGENPCNVQDGKEGVMTVSAPDRSSLHSTLVLVSFANEDEADKALSKNTACFDSRKIELSRVTPHDAQRILFSSYGFKSEVSLYFLPTRNIPPSTSEMTTSMMSNKWVHLQYHPWNATAKDILQFLGEHTCKNIAENGFHTMFTSASEEPIGEVFIKMNCEDQAAECVALCKSKIANVTGELVEIVAQQCNWLQVQRRLMLVNTPKFYWESINPRIEQRNQVASSDRYNSSWIYLDTIPQKANIEDVLKFLGKRVCKEMVKNAIYLVCGDEHESTGDGPVAGAFIKMMENLSVYTCKSQCGGNFMNFDGELYWLGARTCGNPFVAKRIINLQELNLELWSGTTEWDDALPIRI